MSTTTRFYVHLIRKDGSSWMPAFYSTFAEAEQQAALWKLGSGHQFRAIGVRSVG